jgi:hypothetical protein
MLSSGLARFGKRERRQPLREGENPPLFGRFFRTLKCVRFFQQAGKKFIRGILLYAGAEIVSFGANLHAVPISALWNVT